MVFIEISRMAYMIHLINTEGPSKRKKENEKRSGNRSIVGYSQ